MRRVLWILFLSLDVLLLLLFAAGYAAVYIPPRVLWWPQLVAVLLPYLGLALVLVTGILALTGPFRLLVPHLALCLVLLARFVSFGHNRGEATEDTEVLTLMTFNAGKYKFYHRGKVDIPPSMHALTDATTPQVLGLQETTRFHIATLRDSLGFRRHPLEEEQPSLPMNTFGRTAPAELRPLVMEQPGGTPYVVGTRALLSWQGRDVALYNLHLYSFNDKLWREDGTTGLKLRTWTDRLRKYRTAFLARAREVEYLRGLLEQETLPYIVSGDFNTTPHNWDYRHLARGLTDTFKAAGRGWGGTFHTNLPLFRIDFILASPAWQIHAAYVPEVAYSDHRPVVARLSLATP
jgi:endonuclease/exonuclease/phosphatase family metal-dependent hydrolase